MDEYKVYFKHPAYGYAALTVCAPSKVAALDIYKAIMGAGRVRGAVISVEKVDKLTS